MATGFIRQLTQVGIKAEMLMWELWAKFKPREWHQEGSFEEMENLSKQQLSCCKVMSRSDCSSCSSSSGTGESCSSLPMPGGRSHHVSAPGHGTWKTAPASFVTGFSYFLTKGLKLRNVITVSLYYTPLTCIKEHFTVQAVPLRQIKGSRSIRYAGGRSLVQSKYCCQI